MSENPDSRLPCNPPGKQADQKFCHACGVVMHISASDCPSCGAKQSDVERPRTGRVAGGAELIEYERVYCRSCGQPLHRRAPLCPHCGAPQPDPRSPLGRPSKNKIVAALLAFFLGGFGVHKFYLGQVGLGILYLLFCWTFIPALIALIEGIVYLFTSELRFTQKYG